MEKKTLPHIDLEATRRRIDELRRERSLPAEDLARLLGFTPDLTHSSSLPSLEGLLNLAETLSEELVVPIGDILCLVPQPDAHDAEDETTEQDDTTPSPGDTP